MAKKPISKGSDQAFMVYYRSQQDKHFLPPFIKNPIRMDSDVGLAFYNQSATLSRASFRLVLSPTENSLISPMRPTTSRFHSADLWSDSPRSESNLRNIYTSCIQSRCVKIRHEYRGRPLEPCCHSSSSFGKPSLTAESTTNWRAQTYPKQQISTSWFEFFGDRLSTVTPFVVATVPENPWGESTLDYIREERNERLRWGV